MLFARKHAENGGTEKTVGDFLSPNTFLLVWEKGERKESAYYPYISRNGDEKEW